MGWLIQSSDEPVLLFLLVGLAIVVELTNPNGYQCFAQQGTQL